MGYQQKFDPNEKTEGHPVGTMWEPHGTIRVYVWKVIPNDPKKRKDWELVLRTSSERGANAVEKVWQKNGFETKRED